MYLIVQMTSGELATADVDETHSTDVDGAPVELLQRVKWANPQNHRVLQHSAASARHSNGYPGNHKRRGSVHPMLTASVHHHRNSVPDRPLVRRKRIRRDGDTPAAIASKQAPAAVQQAVAPAPHFTTTHRRSAAELINDESKPKPGHVGKIHRRKFVQRRKRGRMLPPHNLISLRSRRQKYDDHQARGRKTSKPVGASAAEHQRPQRAHDKRRLLPDHHRPLYRTRPAGKSAAFLQPRKHRAGSFPESVVDQFYAHPAATLVHRHVGVPPRRRATIAGSTERRRRLPAVSKSLSGGPQHQQATVGSLEDANPLKHGDNALHRPRIRTGNG